MHLTAVIVLLGCVLTACSNAGTNGRAITFPGGGDATATPADRHPGEIVGAPVNFDGYRAVYAATSSALRINYRSTDSGGKPTIVSGTVFVPKGPAPKSGWPIVAYGHPTTGIRNDCAPSSSPDLFGSLPQVLAGVRKGFVVVVPDYQGLGTPGRHPYLEPRTAARNVIDAVRAARQVVPDTSHKWAGYGYSQGAQAVWAAAELAPEYGDGLDMVGAAALAPPADVTGLVDRMQDGTLTIQQKILLPLVLKGLQVEHPALNVDRYIRGPMADRLSVFFQCTGSHERQKNALAAAEPPEDLRPPTPEAAQRLRNLLEDNALPSARTPVPIFVAYGGHDQLVDPAWTRSAIADACAMGNSISSIFYQSATHEHLPASGAAVDWILARFAGDPEAAGCIYDVAHGS